MAGKGSTAFGGPARTWVVTDLVMPETEGLEVLRELRNARPPVKIIAISGAGPHEGRGAAKMLQNPFTSAMLIAAVKELLPGDT